MNAWDWIMTLKNLTFKNRCLVIGISCWMVVALVLALIISASAADLKVIGAIKGGAGGGWSTGYGVYSEAAYRNGPAGATASGSLYNQQKTYADGGYSYSWSALGQWFVWDNFYVGAGYTGFGYKTTLPGGRGWRKDALSPIISVGYQNGSWQLKTTHTLREDDTKNKTEHLGFLFSAPIYKRLVGLCGINFSTGEQGGSRINYNSYMAGIGVFF